MSLYAKRLERGRFIWPSPADGVVAITPAQLAYMLEGIHWRNSAPLHSWWSLLLDGEEQTDEQDDKGGGWMPH